MASDSQAFGKSRRLLNAADYKEVFDHVDVKVSGKAYLCLSKLNSKSHPRLGLIMAKKNVKHAVQRNRIKRIIRESFRLHQHELPPLDIIVLARRGLDDLTNAQLHAEFENAWRRLIKKAQSPKKQHS